MLKLFAASLLLALGQQPAKTRRPTEAQRPR